jgi:hypothetical protein
VTLGSRGFELTAPFALLAAGGLLMARGGSLLESNWAPETLALTHLATIGFLSLSLMGLAYARTASFQGAREPSERVADLVHALMLVGVVSLVVGLIAHSVWLLFVSLSALGLAVPLFVTAVLRGLRGVRHDLAASALRLAVGSLLISAAIGVWMLHGHAGMLFPGPRPLWLQVHLSVALLGWFGGMFASLSGSAPTRLELTLLAAGVMSPPAVLIANAIQGSGPAAVLLATAAASPAAVAVWGMRPLRTLRGHRGAPDGGIGLRRAGFALAPGVAVAALLAVSRIAPGWNLLLGWIALWGWAGLVVHGLLLRGARPGSGLASLGMGLHVAALVAGVVATVSGLDWLVRAAGVLVAATGICLAQALRETRLRRPRYDAK